MTRIFGYESKMPVDAHIPFGVKKVFDNLQTALIKTYENGWQAYGLGFIVIDKNGEVSGYSIHRGYRGLGSSDMINSHLPHELMKVLAENPRAVFAVLENEPDEGLEVFKAQGYIPNLDIFPLESESWLVITMGYWSNLEFSDEGLPWYDSERPWMSINHYLEQETGEVNFDWIDKRRTPYVIAVKKDGSKTHISDMYSDTNIKGYSYVKAESDNVIIYQGVRNSDGQQV